MLNFIFLLNLIFHPAQAGVFDNDCSPEGNVQKFYEVADDMNCRFDVGSALLNQWGASHAYQLTRTSAKKYKAEINPWFYAQNLDEKESIWSFANRSSAAQKEYVNLMNMCFSLYAPFLKGPNGQSLEIKAVESKDIPPTPIHIQSSNFRSNIKNYAENIDCPTILHETLHILGLEDEYKEESMGYIRDPITGERKFVNDESEILAYDCRA